MGASAVKMHMGKSTLKQLQVFCVITLLICMGAYSKVFVIAAALLCMAIALFKNIEYTLELLFFLTPAASVFKLSAGQASLYSYLALFFVIKTFFLKAKYSGTIAGVLLMASYLLFGGSLVAVMRCKDVLLSILVCYLVMTGDLKLNFERLIAIFSVGVITSAAIAVIANNTSLFPNLVFENLATEVNGEEVTRFLGLYENSNYYTLDITMLCACYMCMYCAKRSLKSEQWLMLSLLLVFGVLASSFSFLITTALTMFASLLYMTRQNLYLMLRTSLLFLVVLVAVFLLMGDSARNLITYRVETQMSNSENLSTMTTGRSDLQVAYIKHFKENFMSLLLGDGLGAPNLGIYGRGPHNTYIDVLYFFGIVGGFIYVGMLISFMRVFVRFTKLKIYQWLPAASLLIRMMAISLLLLNNITFYYLLVWLAFRYGADQEEGKGGKGALEGREEGLCPP